MRMLSIVSRDKDVQRSSQDPNPAGVPEPQAAEPSAEGGAADEKRGSPRRAASAMPSIESVRISPHRAEAVLINISDTGVLVECGMRLQPGTRVTVLFSGSFTPSSVPSRVARSVVSGMAAEGIRYQVGIAFNQPIELPELPPEAVVEEPAVLASAESAGPEGTSAPEPPSKPLVNRW
jgi:hypothetical protein